MIKILFLLSILFIFSCTKDKPETNIASSSPETANEGIEAEEDCGDPDEIARKIKEANEEPSFSLTKKDEEEGCTIEE
jgi:hypothetical protein